MDDSSFGSHANSSERPPLIHTTRWGQGVQESGAAGQAWLQEHKWRWGGSPREDPLG